MRVGFKKNVTDGAEQLKHNFPPAYVSNVINIKLSISINHAKLTTKLINVYYFYRRHGEINLINQT